MSKRMEAAAFAAVLFGIIVAIALLSEPVWYALGGGR